MIFFTVGIHLYEVSLYSFFCKKRKRQKKKMMNWNFWSILITWISLCGCPSASHAALNSLVQSYVIFLFSYHRIFSLFMPVFGLPTLGKSTFLTHSHELHSLQSPVKKGVGCCVFVFFFSTKYYQDCGLQQEAWKSQKNRSITQVYDKKKLGN